MPLLRRNRPGLSVLELLLGVVILGVLASIAVFGMKQIREKSYSAAMLNDLRNFTAAQIDFFETSDLDRYATAEELAAARGFAWSKDITVASSTADQAGFTVLLSHAKTNVACTQSFSSAPGAPSTDPYCYKAAGELVAGTWACVGEGVPYENGVWEVYEDGQLPSEGPSGWWGAWVGVYDNEIWTGSHFVVYDLAEGDAFGVWGDAVPGSFGHQYAVVSTFTSTWQSTGDQTILLDEALPEGASGYAAGGTVPEVPAGYRVQAHASGWSGWSPPLQGIDGQVVRYPLAAGAYWGTEVRSVQLTVACTFQAAN
jgi:type II secretory pathway pseudopilin PulG